MERFLNKVGLYDFFGIWCVGAIATLYYGSAFFIVTKGFGFAVVTNFVKNNAAIVSFIATIGFYFIGMIFHEIGKWLFDLLYDHYAIHYPKDWRKAKNSKIFLLRPFKSIQHVVYSNIEDAIDAYEDINIDTMNAGIKRDTAAYSICRKFQAIYGLSRGLFAVFISEYIFFVFVIHKCSAIDCETVCWFLVFNTTFCIMFCCRTYRYYLDWIKNVIKQYNIIYALKNNRKLQVQVGHPHDKICSA